LLPESLNLSRYLRHMHQQINLFQPVFRKQEKVFSAITLAQVTGAVLVLLIVILGHARWTLASMESSAETLQQRHDHIRSQIGSLEEAYRTPDTEALDAEIEKLLADIAQRKFLLVQFDQLIVQHQTGFANQFRVLAEQHVPGLWLEGVTVNGTGDIEIRGITLNPKLVPVYIQHLEKRQDLSESSFETLSMNRINPDKPHVQFVLRNYRGESP
jgi:hypothetical protein